VPATPGQRLWQRRVEGVIALGAPVLDLIMTAADRGSRLLFGPDRDYYPIRSAAEADALEELRRHPREQRRRLETVD
jgi:hypothetical protein